MEKYANSSHTKISLNVRMLRKKSQVWIETMIYTLIGLAIMGILLSIVKPAIEKKQDQVLIEKSIELMSTLENEIEDIRYYGVGNSRIVEVGIKKGRLEINSGKDLIEFFLESKYMYSEPGEEVKVGRIGILTEGKNKDYRITLRLNYTGILNFTWMDGEDNKIFYPAPSLQKITITNKGKKEEYGNLTQIDFS